MKAFGKALVAAFGVMALTAPVRAQVPAMPSSPRPRT